MQALLAPTIPGVTEPAAYERRLPQALRAVALKDDDDRPRTPDDRAGDLLEEGRRWFEAWEWAYREAREIIAHENGAMWGFTNPYNGRYVSTPEAKVADQIRITVNLMKPAVSQAESMLTSEKPVFGCGAATSEGSDLAAAEAGNELLEFFWRFHGLGEKYRSTARGAFSIGTTFLLTEWDQAAGPIAPSQNRIMSNEDGTFGPEFESQGDLKFTVLQREQVAFDPSARDENGGVGLFTRRRMSRARLLQDPRFKGRSAVLQEFDGDDSSIPDDRGEEYVERFSPATGRAGEDPQNAQDELTVYTFYLRASATHPQGATYIFTDEGRSLFEGVNEVYPSSQEVAGGELWPPHNWPVTVMIGDRRENCPWGRGRSLDAIPLNKAVNGAFSKAVQHVALIANAKPYLPKGIDFEWTDEPGQVIRYGRNYQPGSFGYLNPPQMPPEYMTIVNGGRELIENSYGIGASSQGQAPTSDASGRLVQQLQQRDQTRITPIKAALDAKWAEAMTYALRLFRRHASVKRRILILGENGVMALRFFEGASLAAGTDVMCFNDQSIPRDPTKRMLWMMNFTTMLSQSKDDQQRDLLLDLMRLRDFKGYLEKQSPHRVKALRHNRMLLMGEVPIPSPWDHALTHKSTLEEFLCSEEYERKVLEQKGEGGAAPSRLEEAAGWLWQYYAEQAQAELMPQMAPPPDGLAMSTPQSPGAAATQSPVGAAA